MSGIYGVYRFDGAPVDPVWLERMKAAMAAGGVPRQALLLPEVVELDPAEAERVVARADELAELGLVVEEFGPGAVVVRETPALLGKLDIKALVRDLADDIAVEIIEAPVLRPIFLIRVAKVPLADHQRIVSRVL